MEANNMKAMREAVIEIRDRILSGGFEGVTPAEIVNICDAALAKPPRQCDVGTPEEQYARHEAYCEKQDIYCLSDDIFNCRTCFTKWAQTPYTADEKGEGDGGK